MIADQEKITGREENVTKFSCVPIYVTDRRYISNMNLKKLKHSLKTFWAPRKT